MLQVSRSGFYRHLAGAQARADRARADAELAERITEIHQESDGTYDPRASPPSSGTAASGSITSGWHAS
ncbi:hypothetical protein TNCT6_71610 [Streptomyces sp. 6-11-2]|nr:hypothetical protein TNCT6_71610 [Streptomyces sp. 6-11-2]